MDSARYIYNKRGSKRVRHIKSRRLALIIIDSPSAAKNRKIMGENWWKCCPVCQGCGKFDECAEPCAFVVSFFNGNFGK